MTVAVASATTPALTEGHEAPLSVDLSGNLRQKSSPITGTPAQTSVSVTASDTPLLAANASRKYLMIQNQDAANPIYVATDGLASVADGTCTKVVAGGTLIFEGNYVPTDIVKAIATGGTVVTHVTEG